MEHPGIRLKKLREARGVTIAQMLKESGVKVLSSHVYILILRAWEVGHSCFPQEIVKNLAEYFGVTTDYLQGLE